jgi:hypothetical protein
MPQQMHRRCLQQWSKSQLGRSGRLAEAAEGCAHYAMHCGVRLSDTLSGSVAGLLVKSEVCVVWLVSRLGFTSAGIKQYV